MMKRYLLLGLLIILAACGGPSNPSPSDITAPLLSNSLPATGSSNVPINVKLAFGFNEVIDEASLTLSATPTFNLGSPTWTSDHKNVVFANDALSPATSYSLLLNAKDLAGNALASTTLTFTTSASTDTTAPSTPTNLIASPGNAQVSLSWQANTETDIAGYTIYIGTTATQLEQHSFVKETSSTVTGLDNGKTYFFALDAVDGTGNVSAKTSLIFATPFSTPTDPTAPTLVSSEPGNGASNVAPRQPSVMLIFSEPMDTSDFAFTFDPPFVASDANPDETLDLNWTADDTVLTIQPSISELLPANTHFSLKVTSARDKAGNILSGNSEIAFTTGEEPSLVSSSPKDGSTDIGVEPFEIQLVFSKPMDTTTVKVEPTLEPVDIYNYSQGWLLTWSDDDTVLTITTSALVPYFLEDTLYTLLITGKSKAGVALAKTPIRFTTIDDSTPPTVMKTSPTNDKTNQALSPLDVFIYFDDLMDETATLGAISVSPDLPCEWQMFFSTDSANDKDLSSSFACRSETEAFQPNTTYTITVSPDAKDTSANPIIGNTLCRSQHCPYVFEFKTTAVTSQ